MSKPLLKIDNLSIGFKSDKHFISIIKSISYSIYENEIVGVVGESGSGKSVSSLAIMGLLPKTTSKITSGTITYNSFDLTSIKEKAYQKLRGNEIAMIFQ